MACCAHAFLQTWALRPCLLLQPSRLTGHPGDHPVWYTEEHQAFSTQTYLYIIFFPLHTSFIFSLQAPLCHHFSPLSDFLDRLGPLLWWMSLIISFQSQEEERGGSQFRTIALTGETVSPWLPRGNGAEMDSCYKRRRWWWCFLAFPSTAWLSLCRGHTLCPLLSLQSELNATADRLWPRRSVAMCCSAVTMAVYFLSAYTSCQIKGCSAICPHGLMLNSGWTGSRRDRSQKWQKPF